MSEPSAFMRAKCRHPEQKPLAHHRVTSPVQSQFQRLGQISTGSCHPHPCDKYPNLDSTNNSSPGLCTVGQKYESGFHRTTKPDRFFSGMVG